MNFVIHVTHLSLRANYKICSYFYISEHITVPLKSRFTYAWIKVNLNGMLPTKCAVNSKFLLWIQLCIGDSTTKGVVSTLDHLFPLLSFPGKYCYFFWCDEYPCCFIIIAITIIIMLMAILLALKTKDKIMEKDKRARQVV